jgi:superfamily II DNA or RNA helicase
MLKEERGAILARLERGETRVVSSVGVLCEGWDQPSAKCCILARPTKSLGLYLQQAGRILRPWTDPETGATPRAIILDHAGCAIEHGLPQDDRDLSLHLEKKRRGRAQAKAPAARRCERCAAVLPLGAAVCPECGFELPVREAVPAEIEAELVEIKPISIDEKRAAWDALCAEARERGYKAGWVFRAFKEKFGRSPPSTFLPRLDTQEYSAEEKAKYLAELEAMAEAHGFKPRWIAMKYNWRFGEPLPAAPRARRTSEPVHDREAHDALQPPSAADGLVEWTL